MFATARIPKNKRIIHYAGEKITHRESARREAAYMKQGRIWCFHLNSRWVIDGGVGGNDARFINHSCTPNCYAQIVDGVIWIRAAKTIEPGDELTYNYQTDRREEHPVPVPGRVQDEAVVHLFYLHGFASSPESGKADVPARPAGAARHVAPRARLQRARLLVR